MIENPIIRREVLSSLRTRKAVAMQGLFLLGIAGLIWLYWPADGLQDLGGAQARQIFSILAIGQLLMVALFAPAFTAASLTSEREHGTFESVFSTTLKPWEIAWGKMAGSLTFLILLVLSGVPALAAPLLLGGVSASEVFACLGVLLLTAVYLGMIGLLVSSVMHRSYRSIIVTYGILGAIVFVLALPAWPVSGQLVTRGGAAFGKVVHVLVSLSPLEAMFSVVWPQGEYTAGAQGMAPYWMLFIPLSLAVILATTVICLVKLHRPVAPPRPREKLKVVERDGKITARDIFFLVDPRKRKKMIRWWQNPVLIKEFRTRPMLQTQWLLRAVGVCLIVSVVLMIVTTLGVTAVSEEGTNKIPAMIMGIAALMVVLVLLVGPAISGGTICGDIETGVWDLMRTTRLSSWQIVSGKFQAAIIPLLLMVLATLPPLVLLLYFDANLWINIVRILEVVLMTVLFVSTAGMFFSGLFLKTSTATAWTYSLIIALGLLTLLVMLGQDRFSERFISSVYVLNPVAAVLDAAGHPAVQKLGLVSRHLKIMGGMTAVMVVVTVLRVLQLRRAD